MRTKAIPNKPHHFLMHVRRGRAVRAEFGEARAKCFLFFPYGSSGKCVLVSKPFPLEGVRPPLSYLAPRLVFTFVVGKDIDVLGQPVSQAAAHA